jgi:hypothetical protein
MMFEEKLNKIIESIDLQNRLSPGTTRPVEDLDLVNLSFTDLKFLAGIFSDKLPEEVKLFADGISVSLKEAGDPKLTIQEKNEKEANIIELFEHNKNPIVYLNLLNRELITIDYDETRLKQLNQSYNFSFYPDQGHSCRDQYIEKLAEAHVQGNNSGTIQYLLKTKNHTFLERLGFIKDVKAAMQLTEREQLKKNMQFLDETESFDLPESEIQAAITQSERERLKEVMRKIDAEEDRKVKHLSVAEYLPEYKKIRPSSIIIPIEKNKIAWKRYAIAASVIGLIAIATVLVYNNMKTSPGIVRNKPNFPDTSKNFPNRNREKTDALASNKFDSVEMALTVRKEGAMGFAIKQEKLTTRIYRLKENISGLPEVKRQIDSLKKLNKTYTFKNNRLSVYLTDNNLPELYKIDNKYYLKITGTLYHIQPSDKPIKLSKVTDNNISDRIDKINYQQDNK